MAQLQVVRRELDAAREAHRQQIEQVRRQIEQLRDDRERVQPLLAQQQREVERLTAERDAAAAEAAEHERQLAALADAAQSAIASVHEDVRGGIPFERRERVDAVESIQQQLRSDDLQLRAGGIEAFAVFAGEELQLVRGSNVWNAPLMLQDGKRRVDGYHARLGLVSQYFLGEDGRTVGATRGGEWKLDLRGDEQQRVIRLIRMLQGQAPPAIVQVPLAVGPAAAIVQEAAQ